MYAGIDKQRHFWFICFEPKKKGFIWIEMVHNGNGKLKTIKSSDSVFPESLDCIEHAKFYGGMTCEPKLNVSLSD